MRDTLPFVLVALAIRLIVVLVNFRDLPVSDHFEAFGWEMGWVARSIATGHGFSSPFFPSTGPTALVCPVYPALLAMVFRVFGLYTFPAAFAALAMDSVFSTTTAVVVYAIARKQFGRRAALIAGWLWAVYPFSVYYSAVYLWDCALTSLLFACCFYVGVCKLRDWGTWGWAGFGVLFGANVLVNPSIATMFPVLAAYAAWQRRRLGSAVWLHCGAAVLALAATLAPWSARNLHTMHTAGLRDGFWLEFWAGNAGDSSHSNPPWAHPASNPAEMAKYIGMGETAYMKSKQALAIDHILNYPGQFGRVTLRRVVRFWTGYWSFSPEYLKSEGFDTPNVPFCSVLTLLTIFGAVRLWRSNRQHALPYLVLFAVFPLPYYLTHASMDYRQPIEPEVVLVIAFGVDAWLWRRHASRSAGYLETPSRGELAEA